MAGDVPVPADDLYLMLVSSVRYALGRMTYLVGVTANLVRHYWKYLTYPQRDVIMRDLFEALHQAERAGETVGMKMDHDVWKKLSQDLATRMKEEVHVQRG